MSLTNDVWRLLGEPVDGGLLETETPAVILRRMLGLAHGAAVNALGVAAVWLDQIREAAEAGLGLEPGDPAAMDDAGYAQALEYVEDIRRMATLAGELCGWFVGA